MGSRGKWLGKGVREREGPVRRLGEGGALIRVLLCPRVSRASRALCHRLYESFQLCLLCRIKRRERENITAYCNDFVHFCFITASKTPVCATSFPVRCSRDWRSSMDWTGSAKRRVGHTLRKLESYRDSPVFSFWFNHCTSFLGVCIEGKRSI